MAIEFSCAQCGKMLRVPDGSTGQQARCPSCNAVSTVPAGTGEATGLARPGTPFTSPASSIEDNPYSAPSSFSAAAAVPSGVQLTHQRVPVVDTLSRTWTIFRDNLGFCLLAGLGFVVLVFGLYMCFGIVIGVGAFAMMAAGDAGGPLLVVAGLAALAVYAAFLYALAWLHGGVVGMFLKMSRGQPYEFANVFEGGRFALRLFGVNVLLAILQWMIYFLLILLPGLLEAGAAVAVLCYLAYYVVIFSMFVVVMLYGYFIVDRNRGALDSVLDSVRYTRGSRLRLLALWLITVIGGSVFSVITCCVGYIAVIPFFIITLTVVYLTATGQPTAADVATLGVGESPFGDR